MGIALWIAVGVGLGSVARWIMPGPRAGGMGMAIIVGVFGALVGGSIGTAVGGSAPFAVAVDSLLAAVAGSLILLLGYRAYALRLID
jgi:uncharacterized membrane protein YeaQ/YmgE (transglycosylase-associated protein family)